MTVLRAGGNQELSMHFGGKTGAWLHRVCRGIDDDPVEGGHDQVIHADSTG
jgi:nucleotidyltransferase/DNA polymerase involved in DNA repair